ncbi:AAA family ATPase [Oceanimonas pelagia]|uniref:AAA family ATPase n=1 Tax=Oceanimonas pelagia TaxID=3028314 RepID=A0AA50KM41_9GAMM|nr:AAA family ATPase [Oceanimonas pelagia]WMC10666.1 AAA family ATPase [Oceanimonas pelagia]
MLNSEQIHAELNKLGCALEPGKNNPSYAYEHFLGNGKYLYVKRKANGSVDKAPLVLHPDCLALRPIIDRIDGLSVTWQKVKSTSYRRYPKDNGASQYGYDANVSTGQALSQLVALLTDSAPVRQTNTASTYQTASKQKDLPMHPLNQILFGPPGTGKTYATTEMAVRIAEAEWFQNISETHDGDALREAVKGKYDELVKAKRVVFTTFHQSFAYEDFIEGIRAETDEQNNGLRYEVTDGIFKQLCNDAAVKVQVASTESVSLEGKRIWKMSLGNTLGGEEYIYEECVKQGYALLGYGDDIDFSDCHSREAVKAKLEDIYQSPVANNNYTLTSVHVFKNQMQQGDLIVVSDGNHKFRAIGQITGDYEFLETDERVGYQQLRRVNWLRQYQPSLSIEHLFLKALSQMTLYELKPTTIDHARLEQLLAPTGGQESEHKPHVLIIDEINRGNISRIFGELITLLEPDKRKGGADARSVILPYSKEPFTVPDNLYVIGTMNTADKSLAQLDLALRRRFSFVEMMPKPELLSDFTVHGVSLKEMLTVINQRIEALLDAEHLIGHSYFMPLLNMPETEREQALADMFRNRILPLLQEYFFDDYQRIGWVLNDPAKQPDHRFIVTDEALRDHLPKLDKLFPAEVAEQLLDRRYRINEKAFASAEAYQGIVK